MSKYLTIAQAQQQLPDLPDQLATEPAIITQNGKPVMVALSLEQFESLVETLEILSDHEFATQLREGIDQASCGKIVCLDDLKVELG